MSRNQFVTQWFRRMGDLHDRARSEDGWTIEQYMKALDRAMADLQCEVDRGMEAMGFTRRRAEESKDESR